MALRISLRLTMLHHERKHLVPLCPQPMGSTGRPADPLAGPERRFLTADARHALAFPSTP